MVKHKNGVGLFTAENIVAVVRALPETDRRCQTADANRNREFDLALQFLESACDCGNEKMTLPDGTRAETSRECQGIEEQGRPRRVRPDR